MRSKSSRKAADEDEAKSKKVRSSRGKRQRGCHSRSNSSSGSESLARKRSKKLKAADKKSTKNKGGRRRRHRSLSPSLSLSTSPSSSSRSYSSRSSSASERSVSPPPRSRSRDVRKKKERGRDRKRGRRPRRSRCYSTSSESSASSRSRSRSKNIKSRKRRSGDNRDHSSRDKVVQDHDNCHPYQAENTNSVEDADKNEEAMAVANKGNSVDHDNNVAARKMESPPTNNPDEKDDILPAGSGSPDAEDLELILRKKALENFRKFRGAALVAGKTNNNGTGKEALMDSPKSGDTKIAEASSLDEPFQRQRSGLAMNRSVGSLRLEDFGNRPNVSCKRENSAGMSLGAESPDILEAGSTSSPSEQKGSSREVTHTNSQNKLQDGRNSCSIVQRWGSIPGSSASAKQSLGCSAGVSYVNGNPRVRSVISIPTKEGLEGGTSITPPSACNNSPPVASISEVRHPPIETGKVERTNGDETKSGEASAPNVSTLSASDGKGQPGTEGKNDSQFEKKTFSRMHDGETVQVSYKVYIPKKNPALARRKIQR
ncbi:hypothetical protein ABZP36_001912 [Zizania latifolia]